MFPKSQDRESGSLKLLCLLQVTLTIAIDLRAPEGAARFGIVAALDAPVPETAIHEDGYRAAREEEVWTPGYAGRSHSPSANAGTNESRSNSTLGGLVVRSANRAHVH
jgi:hypothetical protein